MTLVDRLDTLWAKVGELEEVHARRQAMVDCQRFYGDPAAFAEQVLGVTQLTPTQREHLRLAAAERRVGAYGANGCGKTFDDALLALYYVFVEHTLVIVTSAREGQLRDQFMRDVKVLYQSAPDLDGELHTLALRRPDHLHSGIICVAAGETSRLRGSHAPRVVFIVEEAQGVPDWVYDVAEMVAVGEHDHVLITGNCDLGATGPFYKRCMSWPSVRFDATQHPNVIEGRTVIPGGPTRESLAQRAADYGEDSPFYQSSVLGVFPVESEEMLVKRAWVRAAFDLWDKLINTDEALADQVILSLDVARYGTDLSALTLMQGRIVRWIKTWAHQDTMETTGRVVAEATTLGIERSVSSSDGRFTVREGSRPGRIIVDSVGLGSGVYDRLRELHWPVTEFNGGRLPDEDQRMDVLNLRAAAYWKTRELLEKGELALPRNERLLEELCAQKWSVNSSGKITLESKDAVRERLGGRSPDLADSVVQAVWWHAGRRRGPSRADLITM